jgi:hypothetical protein
MHALGLRPVTGTTEVMHKFETVRAPYMTGNYPEGTQISNGIVPSSRALIGDVIGK